MFYYRPWARLPGSAGRGGGGGGAGGRYPDYPYEDQGYQDYPGRDYDYRDPLNDVRNHQFTNYRWGFGVLLLLTLAAALVLNLGFVLSFAGSRFVRRTPHWALLALAARDLLVVLVLIPTAVDWMVVNLAQWGGGQVWCSAAGFLDFTLAAMYPAALVVLAVTLYTRNYFPPELPEDEFDDPLDLPMDPLGGTMHTSSRAPSVANSYSQHQHHRPPSVVGSDTGYRNGHRAAAVGMHPRHASTPAPGQQQQHNSTMPVHNSYPQPQVGGRGVKQPFHVVPNRPGSVTGSIEGRLAAGRMAGAAGGAARLQQLRGGGRGQAPPAHNFRASSPLREADEMGSELGDDLWDAASLDYPGRDSPNGGGGDMMRSGGVGHPHHGDGWEFMNQDGGELSYSWQTWLLLFLLVALGFGIPAAMNMVYVPRTRPGCMIPVNPFSNPYSPTIEDFGFNFLLVFVIVCLFVPVFIISLVLSLICYHRRANKHFHTWVKLLVALFVVFILSRCPVDIVSFKWLMEASSGVTLRDHMDIEIEIVLIWVTFIPTVLNPVLYFVYLGEHRRGLRSILSSLCPCDRSGNRRSVEKVPPEDQDVPGAQEDMVIKETQETGIL